MALKLRELMEYGTLNKMTLVAGKGGLDRIIASVGIADYEFTEGFQDQTKESPDAFESDSLVISSLLFAHDDPEKILSALQILQDFGVSAFAYKSVLYFQLPREVLDFAEKNDFPIFRFGSDLYFEDVIYKVTEAISNDDNMYLSEAHIEAMIDGRLSRYDIEKIAKGVSLLFKRYVVGAYIVPKSDEERFDIERIFRNIHLNKSVKSKAMVSRYKEGLFIIATCGQKDYSKFELIFREVIDGSSLNPEDIRMYTSDIHHPYNELDMCVRESYQTFQAQSLTNNRYTRYSEIGTLNYIIPFRHHPIMMEYSERLLKPLEEKEELMETVIEYVKDSGDIVRTADFFQCHPNTIRYRMGRVKELTGLEYCTEFEFYERLSLAVKVRLLKKQADL